MNQELAGLSEIFKRFAKLECRGSSPLYERLSFSISEDAELLELAANARKGQPIPNLFFAAVHSILLSGYKRELSSFYASITDVPNMNDNPFPSFRDFCLSCADDIKELLEIKLVQTNVVERCSNLLPAFGLVAKIAEVSSLSLLEVGTSAGLNLFWDRYGYDYGEGLTARNANAPVQLISKSRGRLAPPIPKKFPQIADRVGLDLNTIDVNDNAAVDWLRALIWPEHAKRVENLYGAIQVVKQEPPVMIAGNALETLPTAIDYLPADSTICIFHTHTLNQFSPQARKEFYSLIERASLTRDIYVVSIEGVSDAGSQLSLKVYLEGAKTSATTLANCDAHGRWLEWTARQ